MANIEVLVSDVLETFQMWRYWSYSAIIRLQQKHAMTSFKVLWEPTSTLFMASVLAIVWSMVLDIQNSYEYFLYLASGLLVWTLLSDLCRQGISSLRRNARNMTIRPLALGVYVAEDIALSFLSFMMSLPFILILVVFLGAGSMKGMAWLVIGLVLTLIAAFGFSLSFGIGAFFFGDLQQLVYAVMRLGFLVTPVIWEPERLGEYAHWVWLNPFFSFLDVCRRGILGQEMDYMSLSIASLIAIVLLLFGMVNLFFFNTTIRQRAFRF